MNHVEKYQNTIKENIDGFVSNLNDHKEKLKQHLSEDDSAALDKIYERQDEYFGYFRNFADLEEPTEEDANAMHVKLDADTMLKEAAVLELKVAEDDRKAIMETMDTTPTQNILDANSEYQFDCLFAELIGGANN